MRSDGSSIVDRKNDGPWTVENKNVVKMIAGDSIDAVATGGQE